MNAIILKAKKQPYLILGGFTVVLALLALFELIQGVLSPATPEFLWQWITGSLLVIALTYQWYLFYLRQTQRTQHARFHYLAHRWVGVTATGVFALHAISAGHMWTSALAIVFVLTAITGILNREIIPYPQRWMYLVWFWVHMTLSTVMIPLVLIHIWVALLYQGT